MRLAHLGNDFRMRGAVTTVQPSSLGTIAIGTDEAQSSNNDSFSRKIQIRSVLEIFIFANTSKPRFKMVETLTGVETHTRKIAV